MKRIGLIGVCFGLILLLTGCGKDTVELTCSMTEDASYASMTAEYHLVYEDEKLTVMDQGAIIEVDEDYANYLSYFEDSFKEEFEDSPNYVKTSYKIEGNRFIATASYDITKMSDEELGDSNDYEEEFATYDSAKAYLEDEGYTCK